MSTNHSDSLSSPAGPTANSPQGNVPAASNWWIIGTWPDLLLIIAPPLLIPSALFAAKKLLSAENITLHLLAFLATGHHLPGLIRAYGDRQLFQRFKYRFLVAPVVLLYVSLFFALRDMQGLMMIAVAWGFWHATMQTYGFVRIYDAKVKLVDRVTARLDLLMCFAWFGMGIVHSPGRKADWLSTWVIAGGKLPGGVNFDLLQPVWNVGTGIVTVAFLVNTARNAISGQQLNPVKFLTMISCFGFWWYSMVGIRNAVLGVALFEIFHDIQYLAIVWSFNRAQVDRNPNVGLFTKFVFRRSWMMACLYVLAVCAYGYLGQAPESIDAPTVRNIFFGIGTASLLLHFYYDGFIWKVRDQSIQDGLRVRNETPKNAVPGSPNSRVGTFKHCLKWILFFIPVALIAATGRQGTSLSIDEYQAVVTSVPGSWKVRLELALEVDDPEESARQLMQALAIKPDSAQTHYHLGNAFLRHNDLIKARRHFQEATALKPDFAEAYASLGSVHFLKDRLKAAREAFSQSLRIDPRNSNAHHNLGCVLDRLGEHTDAITHFQAALDLGFDNGQVRNNFGLALLHREDVVAAAVQFEAAVTQQPNFRDAYFNLGLALQRQHVSIGAIASFRRAVSLDPNFVPALNRLAWLLATSTNNSQSNGDESVSLSKRAATLTEYKDPLIVHTLATAYAHAGNFKSATETIDKALILARQTGNQKLIDDLTASAIRFRSGQELDKATIAAFEKSHL
jgi:Tfp pilus assembly protein PilF